MKRNKGFTLIELLVVIAIIGLLSSVVMASLNSARAKGKLAAVQANLKQIITQAELDYGSIGSYAGLCTNGTIIGMITAAKTAAGETGTTGVALATAQVAGDPVCHENGASGWVVSTPISTNSGTYWCVDHTGVSKQTTTVVGANAVVCP